MNSEIQFIFPPVILWNAMAVAKEVERSSISVRVGGLIPGPWSLHVQDTEPHIAPGSSSTGVCVCAHMNGYCP